MVLSMCTNFGSAGIPGTRLKVPVWGGGVVVVGGGWITYPLPYNTSPRLGAWSLNLRLGLDCYNYIEGDSKVHVTSAKKLM